MANNLALKKCDFIMKTLEQHVLSLQDQPFSLPLSLVDVIKHQIYYWWRMLMIGLHYTKAFSNPFKLAKICLHDDVNDKEIFNCVL
jgi:hypothetical protein